MKNINIKIIGIVLTVAVLFNSCEDFIDPEINKSPNSPADVPLSLLLPSTQAGIAYVFGGDHSRMSGMWMQHLSGVTRQSFALERFSVLESDGNNLWNTLYGGTLKNMVIMMDKSQDQGAVHYEAVTKVLVAFTLGILTDVWGDIPYSDALRGEGGNLTPEYDSQEQIYATMNTYLNEAITLLGQTTPVGVARPGGDDLLFGGDTGKWLKVARSLKVRYALHLSERNGYAPVRDLINAGGLMENNADNLVFKFSTNANEWNPRYQFDSERGDIRVGARIVDLMNATEDPRRPVYFESENDTTVVYIGALPGSGNADVSWIGPGYASQSSPVNFLTYYELKFIEAEAFMGTDNARAAEAYNAAVKASLASHGVGDTDWEAVHAAETDGTISMEKIMTGKYIALFMHSETWVDWRRTGIPTLQLPDANVSETPRRYLYPLDERLYNTANTPTGQTSTSRVWWDVD
jgi:hypothetical protein